MPARRARSSPSRIEYPTHHSQHKPNSVTHPKPSVTPDQPRHPRDKDRAQQPPRNKPASDRANARNETTLTPDPFPRKNGEGEQTKIIGPLRRPIPLTPFPLRKGGTRQKLPVPPFHPGKGSGEIISTLEKFSEQFRSLLSTLEKAQGKSIPPWRKLRRTFPVPPFHPGKGSGEINSTLEKLSEQFRFPLSILERGLGG